MTIEQMLVAVDGSPNAATAVDWAAAAAAQLGAAVVAVHAVGLLEHQAAGAEAALDGPWTAPLRAAGIACTCIARHGNPTSVILDVAAERDVDLIVLGSRGLGGYPELLLGSTSTQVAQHSTRPVVIVPGHRDEGPPKK